MRRFCEILNRSNENKHIVRNLVAAESGLWVDEQGMISVNEPLLGERELDYVAECVRTGWISSAGKFIEEFESQMGQVLLPAVWDRSEQWYGGLASGSGLLRFKAWR